jgi:hypothetical protein
VRLDRRGRFSEAAAAEHADSGAVAAFKGHGAAEAPADTSGIKTLVAGADDNLPISPAWRDGYPGRADWTKPEPRHRRGQRRQGVEIAPGDFGLGPDGRPNDWGV